MNYAEYRKAFYTDPAPEPRYKFSAAFSVSLYFENYSAAGQYYSQVLGPPAYVEGEFTRGWPVGPGWLTLFKAASGNPVNAGVTFHMDSAEHAEALQQAFIEAGGEGPPPSDELMYEPVRFCLVNDPFGTELLIVSRINGG
jgi:hypothetical protein